MIKILQRGRLLAHHLKKISFLLWLNDKKLVFHYLVGKRKLPILG